MLLLRAASATADLNVGKRREGWMQKRKRKRGFKKRPMPKKCSNSSGNNEEAARGNRKVPPAVLGYSGKGIPRTQLLATG
jgi:hypothetical protein